MTAPRRVMPGTSYLVTRRCSERRFFLRPSALTSAIFLFVLAVVARRHRIQVHAFCVLSNHYHLVITDLEARLPRFMQELDSLVARATNALLGRWEGFWARDNSYSAVEPITPADVVAKTAYALANPVAARLVRRACEWPGLWSGPDGFGKPLVAARPKIFFRDDGDLPERAELVLVPPPGFTTAEFQSDVSQALDVLEDQHRREAASEGRAFLGAARVRAQSPFARPAPGEPRRELDPRVACRDKWKRVEALSGLVQFRCEYRDALLARRAGDANVVFPAGTYQLRVEHGVRCAVPS